MWKEGQKKINIKIFINKNLKIVALQPVRCQLICLDSDLFLQVANAGIEIIQIIRNTSTYTCFLLSQVSKS